MPLTAEATQASIRGNKSKRTEAVTLEASPSKGRPDAAAPAGSAAACGADNKASGASECAPEAAAEGSRAKRLRRRNPH